MSKAMVASFFPSAVAQVESIWLGRMVLHTLIFPDDVAAACPEVVMNFFNGSVSIRQPILSVCAAGGVWIGFRGAVDLYNYRYQQKRQQQQQRQRQPQRNKRNEQILWVVAFAAFGIMNLSALFLHCFLPAPTTTTTYPHQRPILWAVDTYMTGLSSICLFLAALDGLEENAKGSEGGKRPVAVLWQHDWMASHKVALRRSGWFLQGVGLICLLCFGFKRLTTTDFSSLSSLGLEEWYLLTPPLAGLPVLCLLHQNPKSPSSDSGRQIFHFGAFVGVLGVLLDRFFCTLLGSRLLDVFTIGAAVFFACDCCFLGLYVVLMDQRYDNKMI